MEPLTRDQVETLACAARERWAARDPRDRIRCAHAVLIYEALSLNPPEWRVEVLWAVVRSILQVIDDTEHRHHREREERP